MKTVEISLERLAELLKSEARLIALERGGVDDWDFYCESLDSAYGEIEKIDERLEDGTLTP
jgi:hypothetical protein